MLVELNCETDFVAKSDSFIALAAADRHAASEQAQAERRGRPQGRHAGDGKTVDEVVEGACRRHRREDRARSGRVLRRVRRSPTCTRRSSDLPPAVGVLVAYDGRRRRCRSRRRHADRRDASAVPHPRRGPGRRRRATSARSPRRPRARRASPSRRSPRSSRVGSTASSRTSSCSSRRRSPRQQEVRPGGARRGRHLRHPLRALRGRAPDAVACSAIPPLTPAADYSRRGRTHDRAAWPGAMVRTPARPRTTVCCSSSPVRCSAAARSGSTPMSSSRSPERSPRSSRRRPGRGRDRRRQLLPRRRAAAAGDGPGPRRLHGHARHRHELPGSSGLPGEARRRDQGADRDHDGPGRRALHSRAARSATSRRAGW